VPGTSSDQPLTAPAQEMRGPSGASVNRKIRVTNLYVTPWHLADDTAERPLPDYLRLWRFEPWSASFIFIGTRGSSRACPPASAPAWIIRRATGFVIAAASGAGVERGTDLAAGGDVPEPGCAVMVGGSEGPAVRAEGDAR
jgi:hypothetical protein